MSAINTSGALKYNWMIWRVLGLVPPTSGKWLKRAYYAYVVVLNGMATGVLMLCAINCFFADNRNDLCESLFITIPTLFCNLKFYSVFVVKSQIIAAGEIFETLDSRAQTPEEIRALRRKLRITIRCFLVYSLVCTSSLFSGQFTVLTATNRSLLYPAWFPFDWKKSATNFAFAHLIITYGNIILILQGPTCDTYPAAFMNILSGHIEALSIRIRRIGSNDKNNKDTNYTELIAAIKDHLITLDLSVKIQRIISFTCFAQFVCSGTAQCTILFYIIYADIGIWKLMNSLVVLVAVSMEMLFLCYFGDILKEQNENLHTSIYWCNWVDQDVQFRKALLLFLVKAQNTRPLTALNMLSVDLKMFVQVIKTSYSVFAVLSSTK